MKTFEEFLVESSAEELSNIATSLSKTANKTGVEDDHTAASKAHRVAAKRFNTIAMYDKALKTPSGPKVYSSKADKHTELAVKHEHKIRDMGKK